MVKNNLQLSCNLKQFSISCQTMQNKISKLDKNEKEAFRISPKILAEKEEIKVEKKFKEKKIKREKLTLDDHINIVKENRMKERKQQLQTKKFNMFEKYALVKIGRFEKFTDVPDMLTYKTLEEKERDYDITMTLLKENGFKITYMLQYLMWTITACFAGTMFYLDRKGKKEMLEKIKEEQNTENYS